MGSGGSKGHESFAVAPGTTLAAETPAVDGAAPMPAQLQAALDTLQDVAVLGALDDGQSSAHFQQLAKSAAAALELASADGVDPQAAAAAAAAVKASTDHFLSAQSAQTLAALAAAEGFAHPGLVGLCGEGPHPLQHYLDPAYPAGIPSKAAIAAKAEQRYAQLAAGQTVHGLTLADIAALEQQLPKTPGAGASAAGPAVTPAEGLELAAAVTSATTAVNAAAHGHHYAYLPATSDAVASLTGMLAAERQLGAVSCPQAPEALAVAQAAARGQVDAVVGKLNPATAVKLLDDPDIRAALPANAGYLAPADQLTLARTTTDAATRDQLTATAAGRAAAVSQLAQDGPAVATQAAAVFSTPIKPTTLMHLAQQSGPVYSSAGRIGIWSNRAYDPQHTAAAALAELPPAAALTEQFTDWSKAQKLAELRAAAAKLGLAEAPFATRSQVTKYIAGCWDSSIAQQHVQAAVAKKAAALKHTPPAAPQSSPALAAPVHAPPAATASGAVVGPPAAAAWMAQHQSLVAALKHHQVSAAALPARHDPATVAAWSFTAHTSAGALGGVNAKSYTTGPDGGQWLFKPDSMHGGARAHAEAAAASVYHRVGIPAVDVHVTQIGAATGSVQPLLSGVTQLSGEPKSWSQADVDAMVRLHVAAWAVGDHDGRSVNMLRTAGGGIVPCDGGQAFRFFGRDKLAVDYHPYASYAGPPAVYQLAYQAAAAGGLADRVTVRPEVAAGVIAAFEQIPDSQYRAMLHATAQHGAAHNVPWVEPMRKAAAKKHGVTPAAVSTAQVADQFLDTAVARKNGLRGAFVKFFTDTGFAAGAAKLRNV